MITTATEAFDSIEKGRGPPALEVRNHEELARWKVEGRRELDAQNLPCFEFIEEEQASVDQVRR